MQDSKFKTDEEIVLISIKDNKYFALLVQRYENKIARYIYRLCGCSQEDIEDIIQEVFINIYRNLNDFDSNLKFSSWVYRIAHNQAISHYRKTKSRPKTVQIDTDFTDSGAQFISLAKDLDSKLNRIKISEVLRAMDNKYKEVLILKYFEEKEYLEISDILKKPVGSVATLLSRAKNNFKKTAEKMNVEF